jgi:hypothetical protein
LPVEKLSSASMAKLEVPAEVGVPEMTPVLVARERPAGREPENRLKLTVPWEEVAVSVWL